MEIVSPFILWKDFDRHGLPLDISEINKLEFDKYTVTSVYYNGFSAINGTTRVYAQYYKPKSQAVAAVIYFPDAKENISVEYLIDNNFAVLIPDVYGETADKTRFTMYPSMFDFAKFDNIVDENKAPDNIKHSYIYVWQTIALRSITYLNELGWSDDKICVVGNGRGGAIALRTAGIETNIKAGASLFNPHLLKGEPTNDFIAFKTALDCASYVPLIKIPFLMQTSSNASNNSLDEISELCDGTGLLLSIAKRADDRMTDAKRHNISKFLLSVIDDTIITSLPSVNLRGSIDGLYFELKNVGEFKTELFVSQAITNSAYRNWRKQKIEQTGEDIYLAKVAIYEPDKPVYAYVNVSYPNELTLSLPLMTRIPKAYGVNPTTATLNRLIYESDNGVDDWLNFSGDFTLKIKNGLLDIEGITSSDNRLRTFKLGEYRYKGGDGDVLQALICSETIQDITVKIIESDGSQFKHIEKITADGVWSKISLSVEQFLGVDRTLNGWSKVVSLEFIGEKEFLINSLLWV